MALTINPDKVCFVIAKAREIDVKVAPEELSDDSDDMERILEDYADDATFQELKDFLDAQSDDALRELLALTWIGRGDYTAEEWQDTMKEIGATARGPSEHAAVLVYVVEPMHLSSPEASTGLSRLEASIAPPEAAPAPMMVWISSMNRIAFGLFLELLQHGLQALFEIAAVLGAGEQCAHVERIDRALRQHVGHVASTMRLARPSAIGGLADAGLADQQRIVLAPPAQHPG